MKTNMQLHREEQDEARDRDVRRFPWLSQACCSELRSELLKDTATLVLAAAALVAFWIWRSGR